MTKRGPKPKLSVYDEIAAVWDSEHSMAGLVKLFDVAYATLIRNAREAGLGKKPHKRKLVDEKKLTEAWSSEHSMADLAVAFGVSAPTLMQRAYEIGLGRKPNFSAGGRADTLYQVEVVRSHLATGKRGAQAAAARELGVTRQYVCQLRSKYIEHVA